jgi:hypothetical protein
VLHLSGDFTSGHDVSSAVLQPLVKMGDDVILVVKRPYISCH